ncbi:MAG: winged helix DNA-binding protein [Alphaproteobacteria bacterium]|nr:winged helix DNA-binding protein [Alphaproteobacteria bacterium]
MSGEPDRLLPRSGVAERQQNYRLLATIGIIHQLASTRAGRVLAPLKLTMAQFAILSHFHWRADEPKRVAAVARAMQQNQPAVTKTIQKLLEAKLLRASADAADRRSMLLFLTPKGKAFFQRALMRLEPQFAAMFETWTQAELADLGAKLDRLKVWLDTKGREEPGVQTSSLSTSGE